MAQYTVQAPDGKTLTLAGPDGASQADIIAQAQKLYAPPSSAPATTGSKVGDFIAGVGGAFADHAVNAYDLLRKIPGADKILPDSTAFHKAIADATPDNTPAHVGKFVESAGEYLLPAGKVGAATEAVPLLGKMAAQGATAGAVQAVQGGTPGEVADTAALGAAGPLVGAGLSAAGRGVASVVQNSPKLAKVAPDLVGMVSPRLANVLRVGQRVSSAMTPEEQAAIDPTAQMLKRMGTSAAASPEPVPYRSPQPAPLAPVTPSEPVIPVQQPQTPAVPVRPAGEYSYPLPGPDEVAAKVAAQTPPAPVQAQAAPAPVEDAATLEGLSRSLAGKTFSRLSPEQQASVRALAARGSTAPASNVVPIRPAVVPPASAVTRNGVPVAEQLRDLVAPGVKTGEGGVATIPAPDEDLQAMMRNLPPGAPKAIADANYAADQEPVQAGKVYQAAGRAAKSQALSQMLYDEGVTAQKVAKWSPDAWLRAAQDRGLLERGAPFSKTSQGEVIQALKSLEGTVK